MGVVVDIIDSRPSNIVSKAKKFAPVLNVVFKGESAPQTREDMLGKEIGSDFAVTSVFIAFSSKSPTSYFAAVKKGADSWQLASRIEQNTSVQKVLTPLH